MTKDNKIKLTVSVLILSFLIYRFVKKNKERKAELEAKNKAAEKAAKDAVEQMRKDHEERTDPYNITEGERDKIIADFKALLNTRFPDTFIDETEYADKAFFDYLEPIIGERKLSVCFLKNFNTVVSRIQGINLEYDFEINHIDECDYIKKGDKGSEINKLKETLNLLFDDNQLYADGNYNKGLYEITEILFQNTAVFSNQTEEGKICKEFIINIHNLISKI